MDCEGISLKWTYHRLWMHQFELYVPWTVKASVWSGHVMDCEGISLKARVCVQAHGLWRHQFNYACHRLWTLESVCIFWTEKAQVDVHVLDWEQRRHKSVSMFGTDKSRVCMYTLEWEWEGTSLCVCFGLRRHECVCSGLWRHKLECAMLEMHRRGTPCPKSTCKLYGTTLNTTHIAIIFRPKQKKAPHRWNDSHRF